MPPTSLLKDISKLKHPNSRRTKALAKKVKRYNNRDKIRLGHAIKSNILGDKFAWFTEKLDVDQYPDRVRLTAEEFYELIESYLQRFDEEVYQVMLKQSISKHRSHQHASRMDVIKMTLEREKGEYDGAGIELMNLCDPEKFKIFMSWDGNSVNLQHFKLDRISRKFLYDLMVAEYDAKKME